MSEKTVLVRSFFCFCPIFHKIFVFSSKKMHIFVYLLLILYDGFLKKIRQEVKLKTMMHERALAALHYVLSLALICALVLAAFFPVSCKITEQGLEVVSTDTTSPEILSFSSEDASTLTLLCSEPVELSSVFYAPKGEALASGHAENVSLSYSEDRTEVSISLLEGSEIGQKYILYGTVVDASSNTLTFELPFIGYNDHVARLILSEVRTETSSNNGRYPEFVELYCLESGNTAGLEILSAKKGEDETWLFPTMEVNAGEYITVHFMLASEGDCVDELENDLTLSTGTDSSDTARDLWEAHESSYLTKSDILLLRNAVDGSIMDGLQFSEKGAAWASKVAVFADALYESGIWTDGAGVETAASSDGATGKRTLNRLNVAALAEAAALGENPAVIASGADFWHLATTATPGFENSTELYTK